MSYSDDIDALNPDHRWDFDGDSTDQIGSANGTDTSIDYTADGICEDVTNCAKTNDVGDRISIPSTTDINNSDQSRKAVAGWFLVTAIQNPPKRIYGEGDESKSFGMILGWGNNIIFEVDCDNFTLQIYGDTYLAIDRAYHLCMIFEGNGYGNELRAYLDGVEQLNASPEDREPDSATLPARGVAEFGDPAGTVGVGGTKVLLNCPVNGKYNQWTTWDGADAVLTDTEVRKELFEKGALPDVTISSNTESSMQTALDVYKNTTRGNAPLCIRIEDCTEGDFTLELDNIKFNEFSSIHIQYTGTHKLTLINKNGANCSITSTTSTGTIILKTRVTLSVTVKDLSDNSFVENARVFLKADSGGDLTEGTAIMSALTNASGLASVNFDYTNDQPVVGWVRRGSNPYYVTGSISGEITINGFSQTILIIPD